MTRNQTAAFFCLLLLTMGSLHAQVSEYNLHVGGRYRLSDNSAGFDPGFSGISLGAGLGIPVHGIVLVPGLEAGMNTISNYAAATFGTDKHFALPGERYSLVAGLRTGQGVGLFRPKPLYQFSFSLKAKLQRATAHGNAAGLFAEARYSNTPGYATYSDVHSVFELMAGVSFTFRR